MPVASEGEKDKSKGEKQIPPLRCGMTTLTTGLLDTAKEDHNRSSRCAEGGRGFRRMRKSIFSRSEQSVFSGWRAERRLWGEQCGEGALQADAAGGLEEHCVAGAEVVAEPVTGLVGGGKEAG
jgi:hypothetical protein